MMLWAGVAALGIWAVLLFVAVPEGISTTMFALQWATHALVREEVQVRFTFWTLLFVGLAGLMIAAFYFSSKSLTSIAGVRVALAATGLLCLATAVNRLWFPFTVFLAAGAYFGFRQLRSIERQSTE